MLTVIFSSLRDSSTKTSSSAFSAIISLPNSTVSCVLADVFVSSSTYSLAVGSSTSGTPNKIGCKIKEATKIIVESTTAQTTFLSIL